LVGEPFTDPATHLGSTPPASGFWTLHADRLRRWDALVTLTVAQRRSGLIASARTAFAKLLVRGSFVVADWVPTRRSGAVVRVNKKMPTSPSTGTTLVQPIRDY
jgi:hypothetical protein